MDLGEILRVMRSRWYVVLPMLMLAVGLTSAAYVVVPTSYESYSTVSLLSSPASTEIATRGGNNPFLNFNGSLVATADFLGRSLQSTDAERELKAMGVTEDYEVALAEGAQGPFLTFTVTGTDKVHILVATETLTRYAETRLGQIQQANGVGPRDMVRMTEIIPPQPPEAKLKKKIEVVIAVGGAALGLAFLVTFMIEGIARARQGRGAVARSAMAQRPVNDAPTPAGRGDEIDQTMVLGVLPGPGHVHPGERRRTTEDTVVTNLPTRTDRAAGSGHGGPRVARSTGGIGPTGPVGQAGPQRLTTGERPVEPTASGEFRHQVPVFDGHGSQGPEWRQG